MPETTPLIKAALNLRVGAGFDVYTGFFCLAIIKGPPNDNYFIIEGPCLDYFTEKVSQTRNVGIFKVKQIRDTIHIASFVKNISAKIS